MASVITVTDVADEYVSSVLIANPGKFLMVGYDNRGCSGHKYTFDLLDESLIGPTDEVVNISHGSIVVPSRYLLGLIGSTLDLVGDQFGKHLEWHNPMAVNQCGCGESFQLSGEASCGK